MSGTHGDAHPLATVLNLLDERVPVLVDETAEWGAGEIAVRAEEAADVIAHYADVLWHTDKRRAKRRKPVDDEDESDDDAEAAEVPPTREEVLDAIALGAAILARRRNGVQLADRHWCTQAPCPHQPRPFAFDHVDVDASRTGAHFTPRALAEDVTRRTLDGIVLCPGPRRTPDDTTWRIAPLYVWQSMTVADIACGSGAFLVAAVRYLTNAYLAATVTACDPDPRTVTSVRMLVIEHRVWGADLNPWSVDLARLAVSLLAPGHSTPGLDGHLLAGDSLIGTLDADDPDIAAVDEAFGARRPIHWAGRRFDAVIGNPPFLGGQKITGVMGTAYRDRLVADIADGTKGSADLSAYFLLRAHALAGERGQVGIIATNTLAQGATQRVGLARLVDDGVTIRYAVQSAVWPGPAAVHYCIVITSVPGVDTSCPRWTASLETIRPARSTLADTPVVVFDALSGIEPVATDDVASAAAVAMPAHLPTRRRRPQPDAPSDLNTAA